MLLDLDFAQVPDKALPLEAGEYRFDITKFEFADAKGNQKDRYAVTLKVNDGPAKDRMMFDNFNVEDLKDLKSFAAIRLKHLYASAVGKEAADKSSGIDTEALIGKSVRGVVKRTTGKDKDTNEPVEYANIKEYLYS